MPDFSCSSIPQPPLPELSEDQILDLLYYARTGSLHDLKAELQAIALEKTTTPAQTLKVIRDPHTGNTAAHYAAANGHMSILSYVQEVREGTSLTEKGAHAVDDDLACSLFKDVNAQGSTPLHYAAVNGQEAAVKILLSHTTWSSDKEKLREFVELKNHAGRIARDEADIQGAGRENWLKVSGMLEKFENES